MKVFALSILGLALAVPAARAQNQDTNDSSKATAQQGTDATKSTAPVRRNTPQRSLTPSFDGVHSSHF